MPMSSSIENIRRMEELSHEMGSRYKAAMYIAAKARRLKESCYHVIFDSEAVEWAISGVPPAHLGESLKRRLEQTMETTEEDQIAEVLEWVEDEQIKSAVMSSCRLTEQNHQIMLDYHGIKDKGARTRIRILTKMAMIPELTPKTEHQKQIR